MRGERGYTLIEALIAIAITGFLVTVLGMVVQQIVTVPERGGDQVDAMHSIQNAAHWLALDGQMASSANGSSNLTLTFPNTSVVRYLRSGTNLIRSSASANRTIAQDVSSVNFTVQNRVIYMTIVTAPDSRWAISENKTYRVCMRPSG
jgi:prepilin-type N-terminal cleavage/methylation domain-containing protein